MQSVEEKNAKRRAKRLQERLKRQEGKKCLNCEILITARLIDKGRSYLYCRKCLTEYRKEVQKHKWRRYYQRKRKELLPKMRERSKQYRLKELSNGRY